MHTICPIKIAMDMRLKERIVGRLRDAIAQGEYRPGERLVENDLCARFKVSRTPVREALDHLDREGLLKITPGAGARIVELSRKNILDIYDMLIVLEGAAARLACRNISSGQIEKLEEYNFLFEETLKRHDPELLFQLNHRFHWVITEAADNQYLIEMRLRFRRLIDNISRTFAQIPEQCRVTIAEHRQILDALKARNPSLAEFTMKEHLENAKEKLGEYLDKKERENIDRKKELSAVQ